MAMGSTIASGVGAALVASSLQTIVETCWNTKHRPAQILRRANDLLWHNPDGEWRCSLCYVQIHPESGSASLGLAGNIQPFVFGPYGHRMIRGTSTLLAEQPDTRFDNQQIYLDAGELLVIASADVVGGEHRGGLSQQALLDVVGEMQEEPVDEIVDHLARMLPITSAEQRNDFDRSLMIVRRKF